MMSTRGCTPAVLVLTLAATIVWSLAGCGSVSGLGNSLADSRATLTSSVNGATLNADFPHRVYRSVDGASADFYLTDLPPEAWPIDADLTGVSGNILHIRLFLTPRAGKTPIATTANSVTIRHLILAEGHVGVYGGGGFFFRSGSVGDRRFGGRIEDATVRLVQGSQGFDDLLGAARFNASFNARRDEQSAELLERRFRTLGLLATPVAE